MGWMDEKGNNLDEGRPMSEQETEKVISPSVFVRQGEQDKLLLTPREIKHAHFEGVYDYPNEDINEVTYSLNDMEVDERVAQAQLAKAKPIIEKRERERIFHWGRELCPHETNVVANFHKSECPQCWQALKEEK